MYVSHKEARALLPSPCDVFGYTEKENLDSQKKVADQLTLQYNHSVLCEQIQCDHKDF